MKWIFIVLLLTSCGYEDSNQKDGYSSNQTPNHGYGYSFDEAGTHVRVKYLTDGTPRIDYWESIYQTTKICVEKFIGTPISDNGILVIAIDRDIVVDGTSLYAASYLDTNSIVINNIALVIPPIGLPNTFYPNVDYFSSHEMIHHFLYWSTGDGDYYHKSPVFPACEMRSAYLDDI